MMNFSRNKDVTKNFAQTTQIGTPNSTTRWQSSRGGSLAMPNGGSLAMPRVEPRGAQLGETLLSQYKKCNQHNREQLSHVKNIHDLVKINVATIDKEMFMNTRRSLQSPGEEEVDYNFKWDPINFKQKMPCMGDRNFLVNQAILQNFSQQNRASTRGIQRRGRNHKSLTSQGVESLFPAFKLPTGSDVVSTDAKTRASIAGITSHEVQNSGAQIYRKDEIQSEVDLTFNCDRGSQLEPVKNLQFLFQQKKYKKRNPGTNLIMEKYKQRTNSIGANTAVSIKSHELEKEDGIVKTDQIFASIINKDIFNRISEQLPPATAPTVSRNAEKVKVQSPANFLRFSDYGSGENMMKPHTTSNKRRVGSMIGFADHDAFHKNEQNFYKQQLQAQKLSIEDDLSKKNVLIRERLENLRLLFEEQDKIDQNCRKSGNLGNQQNESDWEINNHKIMYQEAMDRRKSQLSRLISTDDKTNNQQAPIQTVSKDKHEHQFDKLDMNEDQLRNFLYERIAELKMASKGNKNDLDGINNHIYKFRASTISNVLPHQGAILLKTQEKYSTAYKNKFIVCAPIQAKRGDAMVNTIPTENQQRRIVPQSSQGKFESEDRQTLLRNSIEQAGDSTTKHVDRRKILVDENFIYQEDKEEYSNPDQNEEQVLENEDIEINYEEEALNKNRFFEGVIIPTSYPGARVNAKEKNYFTQCMKQIAKIDKDFEKRDKDRKLIFEEQKIRDQEIEQNFLYKKQNVEDSQRLRVSEDLTSPENSPSPDVLTPAKVRDSKQVIEQNQPNKGDTVLTEHIALKNQSLREQYPQTKLNILDQFDMRQIIVEAQKIPVSAKRSEKRAKSGFRITSNTNKKAVNELVSTFNQDVKNFIQSISPRNNNNLNLKIDYNVSNKASTNNIYQEERVGQSHMSNISHQVKDSQVFSNQRGRSPLSTDGNTTDLLKALGKTFSDINHLKGEFSPSTVQKTAEFSGKDDFNNDTIQSITLEKNETQIFPPQIKISSEKEKNTQNVGTQGYMPNFRTQDLLDVITGKTNENNQQKLQMLNPLANFSNITGAQLAYFSPKRFNRFPRFTIFFKKGNETEQNQYEVENTVSLNVDFLRFLVDNQHLSKDSNATQQIGAPASLRQTSVNDGSGISPRLSIGTDLKNMLDTNEIEKKLTSIPSDVAQWNNYLKQQNFDPFDKVVLVKGIDNQILTSYRTLKGENNTVSDTFKIVHKKFLPQKNTNQKFFKQMMQNHLEKMPYPINQELTDDDEIAFDFIEELTELDYKENPTICNKEVNLQSEILTDTGNNSLNLVTSRVNSGMEQICHTPVLLNEVQNLDSKPINGKELAAKESDYMTHKRTNAEKLKTSYVQIQKLKQQQYDRKMSPLLLIQQQSSQIPQHSVLGDFKGVSPIIRGGNEPKQNSVDDQNDSLIGQEDPKPAPQRAMTMSPFKATENTREITKSEARMSILDDNLMENILSNNNIDVYVLKKIRPQHKKINEEAGKLEKKVKTQKMKFDKTERQQSPQVKPPIVKQNNENANQHPNAFIPVTQQRNPYKQKQKPQATQNMQQQGQQLKNTAKPKEEQVIINEKQTSPVANVEKVYIYAPIYNKISPCELEQQKMSQNGCPEVTADMNSFPDGEATIPRATDQFSIQNIEREVTDSPTINVLKSVAKNKINSFDQIEEHNQSVIRSQNLLVSHHLNFESQGTTPFSPQQMLTTQKLTDHSKMLSSRLTTTDAPDFKGFKDVVQIKSKKVQPEKLQQPLANVSSHVGILKVPSSLFGGDQINSFVEKLANGLDKKSKVTNKQMIDKIFEKERKYTKLHDKDSFLIPNNLIFQLDKATKLKSATGVERNIQEKVVEEEDFSFVMSCTQEPGKQNANPDKQKEEDEKPKSIQIMKNKTVHRPINLQQSSEIIPSDDREVSDYHGHIERIFQHVDVKQTSNDEFAYQSAMNIQEIKRSNTKSKFDMTDSSVEQYKNLSIDEKKDINQ